MDIAYPNLAAEIARRGVKKSVIASRLGISEKSLYNKLAGKAPFTWKEACETRNCFFPDMEKDYLFAEKETTA